MPFPARQAACTRVPVQRNPRESKAAHLVGGEGIQPGGGLIQIEHLGIGYQGQPNIGPLGIGLGDGPGACQRAAAAAQGQQWGCLALRLGAGVGRAAPRRAAPQQGWECKPEPARLRLSPAAAVGQDAGTQPARARHSRRGEKRRHAALLANATSVPSQPCTHPSSRCLPTCRYAFCGSGPARAPQSRPPPQPSSPRSSGSLAA